MLTVDDLKTLDYACEGQPFCSVPAKDTISLNRMDFAFQAQPFVTGAYFASYCVGNVVVDSILESSYGVEYVYIGEFEIESSLESSWGIGYPALTIGTFVLVSDYGLEIPEKIFLRSRICRGIVLVSELY